MVIFCIFFGYILGSIPFGLLITQAKHIDIRKVGSGNIGGTNVSRALGLRWGIVVSVLDLLKSFVVSYIAIQLFPGNMLYQSLISLMPVLGHMFPVWLGFRGGKGVATVFGIVLAYFGPVFFACWILLWVLSLYATKLMSLCNLVMAVSLPFLFWFRYHNMILVCFGAILCVMIWWGHHTNIGRLMKGTENKLKI